MTMKIAVTLTLASLLWTLAASQSGIPVISQHPMGGIYAEGVSVTLTCLTESPVSHIDWHRGNDRVGSAGDFVIVSFSATDAGSYTCRATNNDVGTVTSSLAVLQLAMFEANPPGTAGSPETQTVYHNQPAILDCGELSSVPPTIFEWSLSDIDINPSLDHAIAGIDGRLYLQLPQQTSSEETFVCRANNAVIGDSQSGYIHVNVEDDGSESSPRVLMAGPVDVTANAGDTVSFQCIVGGSPVPQSSEITWTSPQDTTLRPSQNNAVQTVRSVTTGNAGTYTCMVEGLGSFSATLTVLVTPSLATSLADQSPTFGDPLTLACSVTNTHVAEWRWYHEGMPLSFTAGNTLHLNTTDKSNEGLYQCFAYNSAGSDDSTATVNVLTIPAEITEEPSPTTSLVFEGSFVSFVCEATGAPPPRIVWLHDLFPLSDIPEHTDPDTRMTTSVVTLPAVGAGESGVYLCRAVNEVDGVAVGREEADATLTVIAPTIITTPSERQPILALHIDDSADLPCQASAQEGVQLQFSWEKDGSPLDLSDDRLSLSHGNTSSNISFSMVTEADSGKYVCSVRTLYEGLEAPVVNSFAINVTATPEILIAPILLPIDMVTSTSFKVTWYFPGARAQSTLTSYNITYRLAGDSTPIAQHTQPISALTEYTVSASEATPVKPYTTYSVRVWAKYSNGENVGSETVTVVTGEDVPSAPQSVTVDVVNNTALLVQWQHPLEPNGVLTNYTLRYKLEPSNSLYITVPLTSNNTRYQLSPVLPRAYYVVQVASSTSVGLGPYSEPVRIFTEIDDSTEATPIQQRVWFILVMFGLGVFLVVAIVMTACGLRFARKEQRKYNIQTPHMEKMSGRSGFGGGAGGKNTRSLTEDEMVDYNGRGSHRNGDLSSVVFGLEGQEESESSLGEKWPYEPSISTTASRISSHAPAYINPPPFEEAIKHMQARLTPAYSGSTLDQPPASNFTESDWGMDSNSKTRMLQEMEAASLHSSPPPLSSPHHPPTPHSPHHPPTPHSPHHLPTPHSPAQSAHSDHQYARVRSPIYRSAGQDGGKPPISPVGTPDPMYDENGYNKLPIRHPPHSQITAQPQLQKASSQPNFATFV